jgi:hypothetical protein
VDPVSGVKRPESNSRANSNKSESGFNTACGDIFNSLNSKPKGVARKALSGEGMATRDQNKCIIQKKKEGDRGVFRCYLGIFLWEDFL